MPKYDNVNFSPAAPLALVDLRASQNGSVWSGVRMLMHTGADVTLLPAGCLEKLKISPDPHANYDLMGFDGAVKKASAVHLDLIFLGRTFRGRFLLMDTPDGILGRDILNHLQIRFDGPGLTWHEAPA